MATQQRPPRPSAPPTFDLSKTAFDPRRLKLPQVAIIGFVVGVAFHVCVVFAVLDDGSAATSTNRGAGTTEFVSNPVVTATVAPLADRTNCNEIRGTDYRSAAERQWFQRNCA